MRNSNWKRRGLMSAETDVDRIRKIKQRLLEQKLSLLPYDIRQAIKEHPILERFI